MYKCSYYECSLFPHPFCQKISTYLDRAKKKVKSLKIKNFDQTSEKRTPPNSEQFQPEPQMSAIQRFDSITQQFEIAFQVQKQMCEHYLGNVRLEFKVYKAFI